MGGCFGHDGTGDAVCAQSSNNSQVCEHSMDAYKKPCVWKETCPLAKLGEDCCYTAECQKAMHSPLCAAELMCYTAVLTSSGTCMKASNFAKKASNFAKKDEQCCIFCKTANPCGTGLKCHTSDPD